jgi:hypothetical protein
MPLCMRAFRRRADNLKRAFYHSNVYGDMSCPPLDAFQSKEKASGASLWKGGSLYPPAHRYPVELNRLQVAASDSPGLVQLLQEN